MTILSTIFTFYPMCIVCASQDVNAFPQGTEGGGAGGGYPGAMRLCPQGPGQPGAQQQDPKQQAQQQAITGAMPVSYTQTPRGQNQYYQRHQRLNTPRLTGVGNMPMPNIPYAVPGQSVYAPVVSPIMMSQIPYQISQPSGARHQTHAPAPTAPTGPPSGSFYTPQPPPQGAAIFIPQHVPPTAAYYGQQLFGLPTMRNSTYPPNSAPNQMPTQQAPPQQPQVVSGGAAANQGMMTALGMQPGGGPPPQVLAGGQQGGQLAGQPGPLVPGQPGAGGPPMVGPMPPHKDKRKRPKALLVTNPDTGIDVIAEMFMNEEAGSGLGNAGQGRDAEHHHHSQVAAEFAARVAAVATESIGMQVAPAVTETPPPVQSAAIPSPSSSTAIPSSEDLSPNPSIVILSNGPQAPPPGTPTPPPPISSSAAAPIVVEQQHLQQLHHAPLQPPIQQLQQPQQHQPVINTPQPPPTQSIPIVSAQTNSPAVDLHRPTTQHIVSVPPASSPARKPAPQQTLQHSQQQLLQESAEAKSGKSKKDSRRPAPPIAASSPPPNISSQQYPPTSSTAISGSVVVQLAPAAVPSPVQQQLQQQQQQQQQQQSLPPPSSAQSVLQKETPPMAAAAAKREQIVTPVSSQTLPTTPVVVSQPPPHKFSFADTIDVKNFVSQQQQQFQQQAQQQQQQQQQQLKSSSNVAVGGGGTSVSSSSPMEQKETNGETDVNETSTAASSTHSHSSSHTSSSHGSLSAIYVNSTKIMERKRRRKSRTRKSNNANNSNRAGSRPRDTSREQHACVNNVNSEEEQIVQSFVGVGGAGGVSNASSQDIVGSKAQQRQKQSKLFKKKDINRKGVEKEGTDMDAFVEHVSQPAAPPPAGAAPTAISVEVPAFSTTNCTATVTVTTVIQETTIAPASSTATSTTTTTSTSVPTSSISSSHTQQQSSQQTPPLEKRIPAIPSLSSKQVQDERDSSETITSSVTSTTSTTSAPVVSATSSVSSTNVPPLVQTTISSAATTTPMSDDSDSSSIEAMVAAKNQENTKVSALLNNNNINNNNINNNNNNSRNIGATENNNAKSGDDDLLQMSTNSDSPQSGAGTVIETMTIERSHPPQLLYNYKEGQWSPLNTDGKKVYDRDFLLEVRKNPLSTRKPDNHIDPDVYRDKPHDAISSNNNNNNNNRRNVHASNSMSLGNRGDNAVPTFMRSSQSQRGGGFSNPLPYSQLISSKGGRGTGGGGGGPRMGGGGSMSGSMRDRDRMMKGGGSFGGPMTPYRGEEPQLHKTANSWKPARNQDNKDKSDEELKTEKLLKSVRGILNKLTPQKFETLLNHVLALPIDTNDRLTKVVHLVFSKAVDEPSFSKEYAELCRRLSLNKMPQQQQPQEQQGDQQQQQQHSASFRKLLLTKCQEEFEKNKKDAGNIEARTKEIDECTDSEKKKELKLLLEEEERRIRIKKVGLVRFIGELYKLKMLTNKIMHGCINVLLDKIDEESLECLCKLLTTIGKELELLSDKKEFDQYFQKMLKLSQKGPDSLVSSRIRFMLQDVIELRLKNWVPRRDENNPKTIEQIHKDAERETMLESALLSSQGSGRSGGGGGGGGRHDNRDDRRGRQRGGGQNEDGWHPVGSTKNFTKNSYSVEPSKLQPFKEIDGSMSLGSSNQWGQWITGAGTKKASNPQVHVNNKFAPLSRQDQEDRKPTMSSIMNRKGVTPSPSLEKDRAFAALKEVMLDSGRSNVSSSSGNVGGAGGRAGSGPPSRESSRLRSGGGSLSGTNVSSSSSIGMPSVGSVSSSQPSPVPPPAAVVTPSAPLMSEDEAERKTKTIIMEWLDNNNIQETVQTVQDTFVGVPNLVLFLRSALNLVLDHRKVIARPRTGHLMAVLVQENVLPHQELIKEFAFVVEMGDDYKVDIPHVWKYIGELLGPVIAQEVFSFADLRSTADQVRPSKGFATALAEIIRILIKDKGPGWIRTLWESSRVQMKDFVPEEDVDKFINENNLGFIMGNGEVQGVVDASLTPVMVEEKILSFLFKDNDKVLDHIGDWLNANVGEKTKENDFIKALTRAVIRASLKGDKFSGSKLLKNEKLIKKFVDNDEGRELACLYSIQNLLVNELVQAPSVLLETFQILYENGTISRDAFLRWKDPPQDEHICDVEHAGKGVALASLQSFFVSLSEQDDTDDETTS
ncbi:eukaryotic translation initiation factor 4G1 isoform X6 [Rhodnius prolixus]|uniref:eukaryotic translation initiation factor 4G1 isoform X6 n=1 Tax=Rhodnius prolixus TaxID=13249 RepID=UPI003D18EE0C